jgi:Gnt-I system low-affinity gluconate transporter
MDTIVLVLILVTAVASLLFLVLKMKIHAFISLMLVSIITGYLAGMTPDAILRSIQDGMGGTLGFIAVVVGLGAIFGKILEYSGGAEALAIYMINRFGEDKAPWALSITGFIIAIPVFLDVAFIILVPIIYALSRKTRKSLLFYGIPLLAGLAATHSFIPPTPGPVAVSEILGANLGWVIILGFVVGIPVVILAGPVFGSYISRKVTIMPPPEMAAYLGGKEKQVVDYPAFRLVILIIGCPLALILLNTITGALVNTGYLPDNLLTAFLVFVGHPFSALLIATFLAMYFLGIRRGVKKKKLQEISNASLGPAGIIILVTGAGGVLKQILIDSGIGDSLAVAVASGSINPVVLGWLIASVVRVTQGSATVAMITAAGIISPVLPVFELSQPQEALVVIAIAAGATILSHVNDSGFWLVGKYLGMDEKQTLQTWTVMETIIAVSGLVFAWLLYQVF